MTETIAVERYHIERVIDFADAMVRQNAQNQQEFYGKQTRSNREAIEDIVPGKLGEIAMALFIEQKTGIWIEPNFEIYGSEYVTDEGADLAFGDMQMDVKTVKPYARWLLVPSHQYKPEYTNTYGLVLIDLPRDFRKAQTIDAEIFGYAAQGDFLRDGSPWFTFAKGDLLFKHDFNRPDPKYRTRDCLRDYDAIDWGNLDYTKAGLRSPLAYALPKMWTRETDLEWYALFELMNIEKEFA